MSFREVVFALALLIAGSLVTAGVAMLSTALAFIVGGVLFGAGAWLVLSE